MSDIVERLKSQNELYVQKYVGTYDIDETKIEPLCEEAAAEITRLREENARLREALSYYAEETYNGYNGSGACARAAIREGVKDEN